jgi:hypothetical protein
VDALVLVLVGVTHVVALGFVNFFVERISSILVIACLPALASVLGIGPRNCCAAFRGTLRIREPVNDASIPMITVSIRIVLLPDGIARVPVDVGVWWVPVLVRNPADFAFFVSI